MAALLANVPVHADHSTVSPTTPVNGDQLTDFSTQPAAVQPLYQPQEHTLPGVP